MASLFIFINYLKKDTVDGAPPYGEAKEDVPNSDIFDWLENWTRPEGPAKVAVQAGHWNSDQLPDELYKIKGNSGSSGGGKTESEINLKIANLIAQNLRDQNIEVDILPATVPPAYWADVFISIHADGSEDQNKRGFKVAPPWRDLSGDAKDLVKILEKNYQQATGWEKDPNISRNMRGYYAFSWWRYKHSIHPMTTAVIFETGFLTNQEDRKLLIESPEIPAQAISQSIMTYLDNKNLLKN